MPTLIGNKSMGMNKFCVDYFNKNGELLDPPGHCHCEFPLNNQKCENNQQLLSQIINVSTKENWTNLVETIRFIFYVKFEEGKK